MLLFTFTISGGNTLSKTHPHLVILETSAICTSGRLIAKLPLFEKKCQMVMGTICHFSLVHKDLSRQFQVRNSNDVNNRISNV